MTTEEKAKAYDEALEKAKKYHEEYWQVDAKDITETLFPQLIESKDEKIMKAVVKSAEEWYKDNYGYDNPQGKAVVIDAYVAGAIDWLKKQKEQKPISFNEPYNPDEYEVVMEGNATSLKRKEQKPVDYDHEMWKNCEANFEGGKKEVIEHPEKYGLQKHAEWSKEDKTMLNNLIWAVHMKSISPLDEMDDRGKYERYEEFLTSLPERFNLQPKQEWSEEDEKVIEEICNIIVANSKDGYLGRYSAWGLVEKLKSLRPSWKPSEEQIQALEYVVSSIPPNYLKEQKYVMTLMGRVIQQLKKLLYGSTE